MNRRFFKRLMMQSIIWAAFAVGMDLSANDSALDLIRLGDEISEKAHAFSGSETRIVNNAGVPGRKILQPRQENWQSAPMTFKLKVDPDKRNYITVKFWGSDISHDHLVMFIDDKQLGYMHLGDYDILDYEACEPRDAPLSSNPNPQYANRFTYTTFLLPEIATKGKSEIGIAIRATGKIWGYGRDFKQFQKNVTQDSRSIHSVAIHAKPYYKPDRAITAAPRAARTGNIPVIDLQAVKERINRELTKSMRADPARDEWRMVLLAEAWHVPWSVAFQNPKAIDFVVRAIDLTAQHYVKEPDKVISRGSWNNCAAHATALILLEEALRPQLDELIPDGNGKQLSRRKLWADLFEGATFQLIRDRRWLANQSQIVDNSAHRVNRAVHILDDKRAVPLDVTLNFVKESFGIKPWSGGINPDMSKSDPQNMPGKNYRQLTRNYLSKELGYVGNYGESTIWTAADSYESTLDRKTGKGDPELLNVLEKATLARTYFRYPGVTVDNQPVMRLEVYIDWRNAHFPGEPLYVGKGLDLRSIYYTENPRLLGCLRDMIVDGYLQKELAWQINPQNRKPDFLGLLHFPNRYTRIQQQLKKAVGTMPMRGNDFVFTDEEIGVVALKSGDDVLFAELFWRANRGINHLAKIHLVTPSAEHVATIRQEQEFIPSGKFSTEPDWVVYGFRPNRFAYPGGYYKQLRAGEKLPIAEHSQDRTFAGKAEFYRCSYGPYEIGMNNSRIGKNYKMTLPSSGEFRILPDGPVLKGGSELEVKPGSTIILKQDSAGH